MRFRKCPEGVDPKQYSAELHAEEECLVQANQQLYASLDEDELRRRLQQILELEQLPKNEELSEIIKLYQPPVPIPEVYLDAASEKKLCDKPAVLHEVKKFCKEEHRRMEELVSEYRHYLPEGTKLEILELTDIACNKHYAITGIDADLAVAIERMVEVRRLAEKSEVKNKKKPPFPQKKQEKQENKEHHEPHNKDTAKSPEPCGPLTDAQATQVSIEKPQQAL